jgi:hypothetical protein
MQEKAQSRFNEYADFFSIRLQTGEKLAHLAGRVEEGMRHIQARCAAQFTIKQLDK